MSTGHKIAIFGNGRIGRLVYAGADCLCTYAKREQDKSFESAISILNDVISYKNSTTLVDSYKKVQHKYYPEKDLFKKGE